MLQFYNYTVGRLPKTLAACIYSFGRILEEHTIPTESKDLVMNDQARPILDIF